MGLRVAAFVGVFAAAGCGGFDPNMAANGGPGEGATGTGSGGAASSCGPMWQPLTPESLAVCCVDDGKAHCVPDGTLPTEAASLLSACAGGGLCVPDPYIRAGGIPIPKTCKSLNDADGRCLSVCIAQVKKNAPLLPQDICGDDEKCVPCVSPLDNLPTGACTIGVCEADLPAEAPPKPAACPHVGAPILDAKTLPACYDGGGAHCLPSSLVPQGLSAMLKACPGGACAPDVFIEAGGNFIPPTCASLNGTEGRCLHVTIPQVDAQKGLLPQATCQTYERCVPCASPIDGKDTGACKLSCDPGAKSAPKPFSACCAARGKCVPTTAIAESLQSRLAEDVCAPSAELCVPTEHLDPAFKPPACTASNLLLGSYTGVCLSDCLQLGIQGIVLGKGSCNADYKCVPCTHGGKPTGAPGCPATL